MNRLRNAGSARGTTPSAKRHMHKQKHQGWAMRPVTWAVAIALTLPTLPWAQAQTSGTPASAPSTQNNDDAVWLNMPNTDLEAVVRAIGQYTDRSFVIDPRVKGTLNLVTEHPVTKAQAYELLLSALRLQGFTVVESGSVARILPEADAKLQGSRVIAPPVKPPRGDQLVTQIFRMRYESASSLVPILRPLIPPNNTISAYPANNSLIITDYADNLRRIQDIIHVIDTPLGAQPEIIPLKHGLAVEIGAIASKVLDEGARAAGQAVDAGQRVQVLSEPRTNSLIVRAASPARLSLAKQLIQKLDQPSTTPGNINVVYLRNAEATKLAPLLRAIITSDPSFSPAESSGSGLSAGAPGQGGQATNIVTASSSSGGGGGGGGLSGLIQADAATNSLIITAPAPLYQSLRNTIEKLDVRRAQVMIETLIVEVSSDKAAELGVQFQALGGFRESEGNSTNVIGGTNFGGAGQNIIGASANISSLGPGMNVGVIRGTVNIPGIGQVTNLGFLARALEANANANVLSRPNIQVLDNEEAKFLVGQNVPFITGSFTQGQTSGATNPFQTFERRDVGLQLHVKPQVSEGGVVKLAIYIEISSVQPGSLGGQLITNKRSFESSVIVEDGNFVVLSGLIEDKGNDGVSKVPLLGDIPVLGALFRYENRSRTKTNTMVFLKPSVIRDEQASSTLAADRYDFIRNELARSGRADNLIFRQFQSSGLPERPPHKASTTEPTADNAINVPDGGRVLTAEPSPSEVPAEQIPDQMQAPAPEPEAMNAEDLPLPQAEPPEPMPEPEAMLERARPAPAPEVVAPPVRLPPEPVAIAPPAPLPERPVRIPAPAPVPVVQPVAAPEPTPEPIPLVPTPEQAVTETQPATTPVKTNTMLATAAPTAAMPQPATAPPAPAPAPTPAPEPQTGVQLIQVAAVNSIVEGRALQRRLSASGFDAYWESVRLPNRASDIIRVRVSIDRATQRVADALGTLKQQGFDPVLVTP